MRAIQKIQTCIENFPESVDAQVLARLILSLQAEADLSSSDLYKLNAQHFDWAIELLRDWRIDRFYRGRQSRLTLTAHPLGSVEHEKFFMEPISLYPSLT